MFYLFFFTLIIMLRGAKDDDFNQTSFECCCKKVFVLFFCIKFALLQFYDLMHCTLCSSITCLSEDHNKKPVITSFFLLSERKKLWPPSVCPTLKNSKAHSTFFFVFAIFLFCKNWERLLRLGRKRETVSFPFIANFLSCSKFSAPNFWRKKSVHFFRLCRFPFLLCTSLPKKKKERCNKKGDGKVCESQLQKERKRWEVCDPDRERDREKEWDRCVCVCVWEREYMCEREREG